MSVPIAVIAAHIDPVAAYTNYQDAEAATAERYHQYWIEKFKAAGLVFTADRADFPPYQCQLFTSPRRKAGVEMRVECGVTTGLAHYPHWYWVTIKSEAGFQKFTRRLHTRFWK